MTWQGAWALLSSKHVLGLVHSVSHQWARAQLSHGTSKPHGLTSLRPLQLPSRQSFEVNDYGDKMEGRLVRGGMGFDPLPVVLARLQQLEAQGQSVAALDSLDSQEVTRALRLLGQQGQGLKAAWERRQRWLQEGLELQRFGRAVDDFAATCANHEAFLQLDSLGVRTQACASRGCFPITGEARLGRRPLDRWWVRWCCPPCSQA